MRVLSMDVQVVEVLESVCTAPPPPRMGSKPTRVPPHMRAPHVDLTGLIMPTQRRANLVIRDSRLGSWPVLKRATAAANPTLLVMHLYFTAPCCVGHVVQVATSSRCACFLWFLFALFITSSASPALFEAGRPGPHESLHPRGSS